MTYYAVANGRQPGIYRSWSECKAQTDSYSGSVFKKFSSRQEANNYIYNQSNNQSRSSRNITAYDRQGQSSSYRYSNDYYSNYENSYASRRYDAYSNQVGSYRYTQDVPSKTSGWKPRKTEYKDGHKSVELLEDPDKPGRYCVYTDGCCTDNGKKGAKAGVGVYWGDKVNETWNISDKLRDQKQTNNMAEFAAVREAVKVAKEKGIDNLLVLSDSQHVIKTMTQYVDKWDKNGWRLVNGEKVKNQEIIQEITGLIKDTHINVDYSYVPGHSGVKGNEEADKLARKGMQQHK